MRKMILFLAFFASFGLLVGCAAETDGDGGGNKKAPKKEETTTKEKK